MIDFLIDTNVVIYLEPAGGDAPAAPLPGPLRIEQANEIFGPHVLAVTVGSTVDFPNRDPFFHNVFSLSRAKTFDLGRYAQGSSKRVVFDRSGFLYHGRIRAVADTARKAGLEF